MHCTFSKCQLTWTLNMLYCTFTHNLNYVLSNFSIDDALFFSHTFYNWTNHVQTSTNILYGMIRALNVMQEIYETDYHLFNSLDTLSNYLLILNNWMFFTFWVCSFFIYFFFHGSTVIQNSRYFFSCNSS